MRKFEGYERGVNLGGWFSQCRHSEKHYQTFICEADFAELASWGIDHVRIPVDYELLALPNGMDYLRQAADWCAKYRLNMILDLHKTAGYSFDDGEQESGFFDSAELQEQFYQLWEQLAAEFGGYHPRMAFELLNEVTDKDFCGRWNAIARECVQRIRKNAPDIYILIGGYWNNSVEALPDLDPPYDDRIVYNFHCYEPLLFTHQGAYWVKGMEPDFRISFPGKTPEYTAEAKRMGLPSADLAEKLGLDTVDSALFERLFADAAALAEERNVPLYCGEYGVIDLADDAGTVNWYQAINAVFRKYGIGHAAWSYRKMDFGIADLTAEAAAQVKRYL